MAELGSSDLEAVEQQLGRPLLTELSVVARCPDGHPLVVRNHPLDRQGKPFPPLFWLTCREAVKAVSRLEAEGWIRSLAERADQDPAFGAELEAAHAAHARERGRLHPPAAGWGGVAGSPGGVKCLHAHYANHLAGGADPVGAWVAERIEPLHGRRATGVVAAVDMGTNSIRLLVAEPRAETLHELARDMAITRLGLGVDRTGRFDPAALERTLDALGWYARRARALGAGRIRLGATSAARDASNRDDLVRRVLEVAGSEPEILSGEREARLSFLGGTQGLERPAPFAIFDIGGGSTELAMGYRSAERAVSVDLGSVRLTERIRPADPPSREDLEAMRSEAHAQVAAAAEQVPIGKASTLVGLAGTTTTVQAIALGLPRYDPDEIHRSELRIEDAERVTHELAGMSVAERRALPVMAPGREDVIVAGAVILTEILRVAGAHACIVSERDILDGLAIEMARAQASGYPTAPDGPVEDA
ncbi:MAG TPA: DUF501 domain-containing protein [Actinomycetota bacterium]|nr:DUF501 domain-containing protein [Actinomycetota bacterium]